MRVEVGNISNFIAIKRQLKKGGWKFYQDSSLFIYCGRMYESPLGNPYKIGVNGSRETVLNLFEIYLNREMAGINLSLLTPFQDAMLLVRSLYLRQHQIALNMETMFLLCHCEPAACHGTIIKKWLEVSTRNIS